MTIASATETNELDLGGIPAVPEGKVDGSLLAGLPTDVPSAPWVSTIDAVLWWHRSTADVHRALPHGLTARPWPPLTVGGLISYRDGPVGPYGEIFGAPAVVSGGLMLGHVPFIAVDSEASMAGGRRNWALPKVMAGFDGDPGLPGRVTASADGWEITVAAAARRRRLPAWARSSVAQVRPDGQVETFTMTVRGQARVGSVRIGHGRPSSLKSWLRPGDHPAIFLSGTQTVSAPRQ